MIGSLRKPLIGRSLGLMMVLAIVGFCVTLPAQALGAIAAPTFNGDDEHQWWTSVPLITPDMGGTGTVTCTLRRTNSVPSPNESGTSVWSGSGESACGGSPANPEPKFTSLTDGWYRFDYSVTNSSGKATATFPFGLDRVVPGGATFTYQTTFPTVDPAFDFTASDDRSGVARYDCRTTAVGETPDPNGWSDCSPPQTIGWDPATSTAGDYTFEVRAEDAAGNQATSIASTRYTQVVDTPVATQGPSLSYSPYLTPGSLLKLSGYGVWPTIDFWNTFASGAIGAPFEFTVDWSRCNAAGSSCTPVNLGDDWVATRPLDYQLGQADLGKRIKAVVTLGFCDSVDHADCVLPTAPAAITDVVRLPPSVSVAPILSGQAKVGTTLDATAGTWSGVTGDVARVWERCTSASTGCTAISGQSGDSYQLAASDIGKYFRITETGSSVGGITVRSSNSIGPVIWPLPAITDLPVITGKPVIGTPLSVTSGTWTTATSVKRAWVKCIYAAFGCTPINGATGPTYTPTTADKNFYIRITETATGPGGQASASSLTAGRVLPPPPTSKTAPSVSGTGSVGSALKAKAGIWSDGTVVRVWERCTAASADCSTIPGQNALSYTPTGSDVGYFLRVHETATGVGGATDSASTSIGPVTVPPIPTVLTAPKLEGIALTGSQLTLTPGTWSSGTVVRIWQRCTAAASGCVTVTGQSGLSYSLGSSDLGRFIRVVETATGAGGSSSSTTASVGPVRVPPPVATGVPTISGTGAVGMTITANPAQWSDGTTTHVWQRCVYSAVGCSDIPGATGASYTLAALDKTRYVRVVETATNAGGSTTSTSVSVGPIVLPPPPTMTTAPSISGSPTYGETLYATAGAWSDGNVIRRWQRCDSPTDGCTTILFAAGNAFVPGSADIGKYLRVRETSIGAGGTSLGYSDTVGPVIQRAPVSKTVPVVRGARIEGTRLVARAGTWSSGTVTRSWERCTSSSAGCTPIPGATGISYTLKASDRGRWVRIRESATNTGGTSDHYSAAIGPVLKKTR